MTSVVNNGDNLQKPTYSYYYQDPISPRRKSPEYPSSYQTNTTPGYSYQTTTNPEQTRETRSSPINQDTAGRYQRGHKSRPRTEYRRGVKETPKRGSIPGEFSSHSYPQLGDGKRNSLPGADNKKLQRKGIHKKLSNSIALPVVPDKKECNESGRKLSNSIAIPSRHLDKTSDKKQERSLATDPHNKQDKDPPPMNSSKQTKSPSNSPKTKRSDPPSNVDETGENAKLLSIRRLGTPERPPKSGDSSSSSITENAETPDVFLPKRYILAIMMFMGFVNMYAVRVNLNVAIGAMVNNHTVVRDGVSTTVVSDFFLLFLFFRVT